MRKINRQAIKHFQEHDETLFSAIEKVGPIKELQPDEPKNYFFRLCREIVGQQLTEKASDVIFSRFKELFSGKKVTPRRALKVPHGAMRKVGLSNAKARYIRNLAEKVINQELNFEEFKNFSNEQVISELTGVNGIGPWTAEMFLMFALAREDIFSHGDLGLRKAIKKVYGFKEEPTREQIEKISNRWMPYRTYACLILWKSLDI